MSSSSKPQVAAHASGVRIAEQAPQGAWPTRDATPLAREVALTGLPPIRRMPRPVPPQDGEHVRSRAPGAGRLAPRHTVNGSERAPFLHAGQAPGVPTMVPSAARPVRSRARGFFAVSLAALLALAQPAWAGSDDFEYGQKLAQNRHFKLARRVYENMLADTKSSEEKKDLARFGLAMLGYEEARVAGGRLDTTFAQVLELYETAARQIEAFAAKNPNHPKAKEAKLQVGLVKLSVALWCRELAEDKEGMAARKTSEGEVWGAARESVAAAVAHFESLRTQPGDLGQLADYHWTMCQYYRAIVLDACSSPQIEALREAEKALDEYIMNHDGELLAVFAQDVLGQTISERAKCASNQEEKAQLVNKANSWFETCIDTEYDDEQTLTVITSGYLHYGQNCLAAGRIGTTNFLRVGADKLSQMLEKVPTAGKTYGGLRVLLVLGDLHKALGNSKQAVAIWTETSDRAAQVGLPGLAGQANGRIRDTVGGTGAAGGTVVSADPSVLKKVADSLYGDGKWAEAIRAYRGVLASAPPTAQGFVEYSWPAWERIAKAYDQLGDKLSSAMAYEAIYDAWKSGRIPHKAGDENDANMKRAGNHRKAQIGVLDALAQSTGSKVFREEYKRARESFAPDFPLHPDSTKGATANAWNRYLEVRQAKRDKKPDWRRLMEDSREECLPLAKDARNDRQDVFWTAVISMDLSLCDGAPDKSAAERGLATSTEALAYWDSAPAKQKLADYPQLEQQRKDALLKVRYLRGEFFKRLDRWDDVLAEMPAFRAAYPGTAENSDDAQALIVEAHVNKGAVEQADKALADLIKEYPSHVAVPALVSQIAKRFDDQYRELTKQYLAKERELRGTKEDRASGLMAQFAEADRELNEMVNFRVTLVAGIEADEKRVANFKVNPDSVKPLNANDIKELEEKTLPETRKKVAELDKGIPERQRKRDTLAARVKQLQADQAAILEQQYQPLKEAVLRYDKGLAAQLASNPAAVQPEGVLSVGERWYFAARNAKGQPEDWLKAREVLEIYLGLEAVKALPASHPGKRSAVSKLGRVYSHLSSKEQDAAKRAGLVQQSITMLEGSVGARAENNDLVLGVLLGRMGQVVWENDAEPGRPAYRFIVPKTASAAELKTAIARLGAADSPTPIPLQPDAARTAAYRKGLSAWKEMVAKMPQGALEAMYKEVQRSGVDSGLWRELGRLDPEFRLSLAQAYAQSGAEGDAAKGEALLATMLRGTISAETYSDDWWEAQTTALLLFVGHSERLAAGGGVPAKASEFRKRAAQLVRGVAALTEIPIKDGVRDEWKALVTRLNKGLRSESAPEVDIDLDRKFDQAVDKPGAEKPAGKEQPK